MQTDLTKSECEKILADNHYAHLACIDGDEPYLVPITYVYEGVFLYGCTKEGKKIDVMRKHKKVCVQVECVQSPDSWESVVCWGTFEEVTDAKNIQRVKLMFAEKHGDILLHGKKSPVMPVIKNLHEDRSDHAAMNVVYRIMPYRMTGKAEKR